MSQTLLADLRKEFERYRDQAGRAVAPLTDEQFFQRPGGAVNSIALILKHLAGNLRSRWTDFLTTDGDKPSRDRDGEFELRSEDTRVRLMLAWEDAWQTLFQTLEELEDEDFGKTVPIRGEAHTVYQAIVRGLTHVAYHVGQILYIARLLAPDAPWLTIAPGQSNVHKGAYLTRP